MTIDFVTIGEITVDDTVIETDEIMRSQTGAEFILRFGHPIMRAQGRRKWS